MPPKEPMMKKHKPMLDPIQRTLDHFFGPGQFPLEMVGDLDSLLLTLKWGVGLVNSLAEAPADRTKQEITSRLYEIEFLLTEELPLIGKDLVPMIRALRKQAPIAPKGLGLTKPK